MSPRFLVPLLLSITAASLVHAAPASVRVDFSIQGRSDALAPGYAQWIVPSAPSAAQDFGSVTAKIRASKGDLTTTWWKGGAIDGARMIVDGITAPAGSSIELELRGLTPGRHSLVTFHNWSDVTARTPAGPLELRAAGQTEPVRVTPSERATSDDDGATAYLEFDATASGAVVITLRPTGSTSAILCGFALDAADPKRQALKPVPADLDEHAEADSGTLTLRWTPAAGAVEHRVYHGHDHDAVAVASPDSRVYLGSTRDASFALNNVRHLGDHFWRVDSVDAQGRVTPGRVWRFRPRRLAFPGAEGYGRFAAGGRGGRVYTVTSLADRGPGTLREAVEAEGPRTVVFAVSGLITLESRLTVRNPYLTIAGQTAPGKGITVRGYNLGLLGARDVVIRHLRVRPGDIAGVTLDGMGMASSDHSIIDHASISWSIDEAFSSRGARNITLQRTLISEALNVAGHKKYRPGTMHGYAASISGHVGSFHHNLLAHNSGRNWSLAGGLNNLTQHAGWLDIRNNVVYNWHNRTTDGGAAKVNFVANYYRPGPATKVFHLLKPERNNIAGFGPQDYYVEGNVMEGHVGPNDALGGVLEPEPYENFIVDRPFFESHVTTQSAREAFKIVLSDVGCTQPMLDEHDRRVIRETLDGTVTYHGSRSGLPGLPDSQTDVGGWEDYPEERRSADWDTDSDGLPDWWERIHNLNTSSAPGDFSEANADRDGDAYTNLEEYLNWIAAPHRHVAPGATIEIDLREYARGFTAAPVFSIERAAPGAAILAPDGRTLRYTAPTGSAGLAEIVFTVRDAEGDVMMRTIGAAVH